MSPMPSAIAVIAAEVADEIMEQALDFARNQISHSESDRRDVMALASAHAQVAAIVFVALDLVSALRDVASEIAGAISDRGGRSASHV